MTTTLSGLAELSNMSVFPLRSISIKPVSSYVSLTFYLVIYVLLTSVARQWNQLSPTDQDHLVYNVKVHLGKATNADIRLKQAKLFAHVNATLGQRIAQAVNVKL